MFTKTIRRGDFQSLPAGARESAMTQFVNRRNGSGPGDGYLYEWIEEQPPSFYVGPLPYVSGLRRVRRYQVYSLYQ